MIEKYKAYTVPLFTALWIVFCWGFVEDELIPAFVPLRPYVMMLCDAVFLGLGFISIKTRGQIWIILSVAVLTILSAFVNHIGMVMTLNGVREFIGLLFVVPIIYRMLTSKHRERFVKSLDKQLFIFLALQTICIPWQFIKYGLSDHGGGTLGNMHSGDVSTLMYAISFYLMTKRWDEGKSYLENIKSNMVLVLLLLPTFFNETKISLVYIMLYSVLLMRVNRRFILKIVVMSPLFLVVILGAYSLYMSVAGQWSNGVFSEEGLEVYFFDSEELDLRIEVAEMAQEGYIVMDDDWVADLPRFAKIGLLPGVLKHTPGGMTLGAGVGQLKGTKVMDMPPFAKEYQWLLIGSRPTLFFILVQLGWLGLIWLIADFGYILSFPISVPKDLNVKLYVAAVFCCNLAYIDCYRNVAVCMVLFYMAMIGLQKRECKGLKKTDEEPVVIQQG